jgi:hypothetical protein
VPADELHCGAVVLVADVDVRHALVAVLRHLQLEHVLVERLLQALVGGVDAKLLEAVVLKGLEAKDVQHGDGLACRVRGGGGVRTWLQERR